MNTQLTIIDQVQDVAMKSGVPLEIDVTQLATLAARGKAITTVDDPNFAAVKKEMQKTRTELVDYFENARKGFNILSKGVIEVQRAVLGEFTPEEDRLIALDKAEKERVIKEARLEALPAKRERITTAGIEFVDEEILAMSDADFELAVAIKLSLKAEADRIVAEAKLAEERAAFEAEKAELARKQAEADAIENARKEERERAEKALALQKETAEREAKEAEERRKAEEQERILRAEREEKERIERVEREAKLEAERKIQEESDKAEAEAKRQATEKFQAFLKKNNHNEETDIIIDGVNLYRFVAKFK